MMAALGFGFPVAFALPGSAILSIGLAAITGLLLFGDAKESISGLVSEFKE